MAGYASHLRRQNGMRLMELGRLGVWQSTDAMTSTEAADFARRVEAWGYGVLWIPEARGRNALVHSAWLLAGTTKLIVATGIANIYGRDAQAMASAAAGLNEQSGGRFLLGLGVSHAPLVEGLRGHNYGKPVATMEAYLAAMARASYSAPAPAAKPRIVLAALGPRMLELAGAETDGAHPYLVPPEHTAQARAILGHGKWLCPEHKLLLEPDPAKARAAARQILTRYLQLDNYRNSLLRLGFSEAELADGGADRVVDALVAWGDEEAIRGRIRAHWTAGADHVCLQALSPGRPGPDEGLLARLAPATW
jgi:probable F420-dependent oxidoreductase